MKHAAIRTMIVAAVAAVVGVTTASAQDLKANIPFKFRANTVYLPAGQYTITSVGQIGSRVYRVRNEATHQGALLTVRHPITYESGQDPRLMFLCRGEDCRLSQLWTPNAGFQLTMPHNKADAERTASVRIVTLKAD